MKILTDEFSVRKSEKSIAYMQYIEYNVSKCLTSGLFLRVVCGIISLLISAFLSAIAEAWH